MKTELFFFKQLRNNNQIGISLILVAILMLLFLGVAALAIDLSHLYLVKNELQNAADAGALAGARNLYNDDGTQIQTDANQYAYDAATSNDALAKNAGAIAVDVNWEPGDNIGSDIERGHWSFANKVFTPSDSTAPVDLWNISFEELDKNVKFDEYGNPVPIDFVNAVRVVARRSDSPVSSFFAGIFGIDDFMLSAEAIAYLGFPAGLAPGEADQPIAMCQGSILDDEGKYSCDVGRMMNDNEETALWTDFNQDGNPCQGGTSDKLVSEKICADGNPNYILFQGPMALINGAATDSFKDLEECWATKTDKKTLWNITLPVIDCSDDPTTCANVLGAVNVNVVWVVKDANKINDDAPTEMAGPDPLSNEDDWTFNNTDMNGDEIIDGKDRWDSFVTRFGIRDHLDNLALYEYEYTDEKDKVIKTSGYKNKTIYFLPDCEPHDLTGTTGGYNFGVMAKIPKLVK